MLNFRSMTAVQVLVAILLFQDHPANAQCEVHENAKLTASDAARADRFGTSVSLDGDRAIVGAVFDDCPAGIRCGSAYVYRYDWTAWVQEQKLTASDAADSDFFGRSVFLDGTRAIVGAVFDNCPAGSSCGSAYVYRYDGTTWVQEQKLTASDAASGDFFGFSVSLDGARAIVGAFGDDCPAGLGCGSAYIYRYDGATWVQEQKLTASDAAAGDFFGGSVSLDGARAIVGARWDDCPAGPDCGSAYVYRYDGTTWVQDQKLTASDAWANDLFGGSVSLDVDRAIVGAVFDNCPAGSSCGSAYVYRYDGTTWVQEQKLTASDAASGDFFGESVSLDGNWAIVGAYLDDCPAGGNCGSAYVYRYDGTTWVQDQKLTASDAAAGDEFGFSVSLEPARAIVGAYLDDCPAGFYCGSAYVYDLAAPDCNANGIPDECDITSCPPGDRTCADCNANGIPDACDVASGTSTDCNANGVPDECDIASCPPNDPSCRDCNSNRAPDACDMPPICPTCVDCNANGVPDACEPDCNANGVPDECDIANCPPDNPNCQDCNRNNVLDECDIAGGTSDDIDGNGVPDDCYPPPIAEPFGVDKNRYVSLSIPPPTVGSGPLTALRVTLVDLQNPVPPNLPQFPPPDFSNFKSGITCTDPSGCVRWVGKPGTFLESQDDPGLGSFHGARLQCTSYYHDWSVEGVIHVTGAEIVPSSKYDVQTFASFCTGNESTCTAVSAALQINTTRSGDVEAPFQAPPPAALSQPDVIDVAQLVNKFRNVAGAPVKAISQLQPNLPDMNVDINALDIVAVVDAVRERAYAFSGPCACPSTVPCGMTACSSVTPCVAAFGAGATCVKTCTGPGPLADDPCINNSHCLGSGTCGAGFCRDRCGRCTP